MLMNIARITRAPDEPPPSEGWLGSATGGHPLEGATEPLLSAVIRVLDHRLAEIEVEIDTAMIIRDIETTRALMDRWAVLNDRRNQLLDGI